MRIIALAVVLTALGSSCLIPDRPVSPGPVVGGLLVLTGPVGGMTLLRYDDPTGTAPPTVVPLPEPSVSWISTDRGGWILATTLDGRAFLGGPAGPGRDPSWRSLVPSVPGGRRVTLAFGTLAPDGHRAAFLAGDPEDPVAVPGALLVVDTATGEARATSLGGESAGWPPTWFGDRLAVLRRDAGDRPEVMVIAGSPTVDDPSGGSLAGGPAATETTHPAMPGAVPGAIVGLAASADGSRWALLGSDRSTVTVVTSTDQADGRSVPVPESSVELPPWPDAPTLVAWLALSAAGDRLAVVRMDPDGASFEVTVHAEDAGWRPVPSVALPAGADRAVAAWLP